MSSNVKPVPLPKDKCKLSFMKHKNGTTYVQAFIDIVDNSFKRVGSERFSIGKLCPDNPEMLIPNKQYHELFDSDLNVIHMESTKKHQKHHNKEKAKSANTNTATNQASKELSWQVFQEAMNTDQMLNQLKGVVTADAVGHFIKERAEKVDPSTPIFLSYGRLDGKRFDGDLDFVEDAAETRDEFFDVAVAYDIETQNSISYELRSSFDGKESQLKFGLDRLDDLKLKNVTVMLDTGCVALSDLEYLDKRGTPFIISLHAVNDLASEILLENLYKFENKRENAQLLDEEVYAYTVEHTLAGKKRYFHLLYLPQFYSIAKSCFVTMITQMEANLKNALKTTKTFSVQYQKYFNLEYAPKSHKLVKFSRKTSLIARLAALFGYFVIVTSEKMSCEEAYKTNVPCSQYKQSFINMITEDTDDDIEAIKVKAFISFLVKQFEGGLNTLAKEGKL